MRWPEHPVPQSSNSLQSFVNDLEKRLNTYLDSSDPNLELAGANVTRSGNIVIHTKAPHTTALQVQQILQLHENNDVGLSGRLIPGFSCPTHYRPEVELDIPWHGLVIHDIPAQPLLESYRGDENTNSLWDVVKEQIGLPGTNFRDLRVLCRDEDMENKDRLSIRIMLDDPRICEHLCRDKTYLFGTQCRVSRYRPRRKRHRPPSS